MHCSSAVSYTHLDVYKRQLCAYRLNAPGLGKELGCTLETPRDMYLGFYYAPGVVCEACLLYTSRCV